MVTDRGYNYTSPAGGELIMAAARIAGINPSSSVLDIGCSFGEGASMLASQFRCKVTAVDCDESKFSLARRIAERRNVSHLITFKTSQFLSTRIHETTFELAVIEGGFLRSSSDEEFLMKTAALLNPRGWLCFSVPIALSDSVPDEIRAVFRQHDAPLEREENFRLLALKAGFDLHFTALASERLYSGRISEGRQNLNINGFSRVPAGTYILILRDSKKRELAKGTVVIRNQ